MFKTGSHIFRTIFLLVGFLLLSYGCAPSASSSATQQAANCPIEIYPQLREYYLLINFQNEMGCAISPVIPQGNVLLQYTQAGLIRYDPAQPDTQRYSLDPLGQQYIQADTPLSISDQDDSSAINGRFIFGKFIPYFKAMGGTRIIGKPVTQPFVDNDNHWIVQFFTNLAFYTSSVDPNDGVHLVKLGALACGDTCQHPSIGGFIPGKPEITEPFLESLSRLGLDLTGKPISNYTLTPDGYIDQIYENVVIHVKNAPPYRIGLLSLGSELKSDAISPYFQPAKRNGDPNFIFTPLQDNSQLGFNEEILFEHWVADHGSKSVSGPVISQLFSLAQNTVEQCYSNYCLEFDRSNQTIKPVALGKEYLKLHPIEAAGQDILTLSTENTILNTTETYSLISSQEKQTISAWVFQRRDNHPIPNLDIVLTVILPDGTKAVYNMPPTDAAGKTSYTLAPVQADNGVVIPYQACLNTASAAPICTEDSFVIWFNSN